MPKWIGREVSLLLRFFITMYKKIPDAFYIIIIIFPTQSFRFIQETAVIIRGGWLFKKLVSHVLLTPVLFFDLPMPPLLEEHLLLLLTPRSEFIIG